MKPADLPDTPEVNRSWRKYEASKRLFVALAIGGALMFGTALMWLAIENHKTSERIENCTTPGEECYEQQTGVLLQELESLMQQQERLINEGTMPLRENLEITKQNQRDIARILRILEQMNQQRSTVPDAGRVAPGTSTAGHTPSSPVAPGGSGSVAPSPAPPAAPPTPRPTSRPTATSDVPRPTIPAPEIPDPIIGCLPLVPICI